eukprot:gnl/MRDRNA2_/MRDRNA2_108579_c0_seq1.p1 gnl/MRDRNA2_/MRDRNA2_108579_c0~~gnl/MRDRNA2_/MRDRNA2_108579_c0_seq1.p1  ORF type:complete len:227 (+),score=35.64 gnl/MRDRNA2_/MRDRNA2_108579_c0_seq1:109-789(+)
MPSQISNKNFLGGTLLVKHNGTPQGEFAKEKLQKKGTCMQLQAQMGQGLFHSAYNSEGTGSQPSKSRRARKAVEANQDAPIIEGILSKRAKTLFGWGRSIWHERWFVLHPENGFFAYWEPGAKSEKGEYKKPKGAPKHQFLLKDLIQLEWNARHFVFQAIFQNSKTKEAEVVLHLQAQNEIEFHTWLNALEPYGMQQGPHTPHVRKQKRKAALNDFRSLTCEVGTI